ncbi:MAG: DMT family transporter [Hyphomicrobiaceae bacterium]|nr:DMT family transporter [Hyphomicrobiaceae bacterium]
MASPHASRSRSGSDHLLAIGLAALAALCWSGNHIIGRAMAGEVPPFATGCIRWFIPAVLLAPFVGPRLQRDWPELRRSWKLTLALSLGGGAMFGTLQYIGLIYTTAINVSVLNSTAPVLIVAAGALLFRDRVRLLQLLGIGVSLAGVVAIVAKGSLDALTALTFNVGDLIILFNMAIWSVYSASLRKRGAMHWMTFTFVLAVISALATVPFWVAEHVAGHTLRATPFTFASLAFVGLFPSLLAYAAWSRAVETIGSGRAGVFLHLVPLYSALAAGTLLGERIESYHLLGFALILVGVALASRR